MPNADDRCKCGHRWADHRSMHGQGANVCIVEHCLCRGWQPK